MQLLITGGAGFVGSLLARTLLARGHLAEANIERLVVSDQVPPPSGLYFGALVLVQAPWQIYPLQALSAAIVAVTSGIAITFFQNKLPGQLGKTSRPQHALASWKQ